MEIKNEDITRFFESFDGVIKIKLADGPWVNIRPDEGQHMYTDLILCLKRDILKKVILDDMNVVKSIEFDEYRHANKGLVSKIRGLVLND